MVLASIAVGYIHADSRQHYYDNVQAAKDALHQALQSDVFQAFDTLDYCTDNACETAVMQPEQTRYHDSPNQFNQAINTDMHTNDQATAIVDGFNQRPPTTIDPNDPSLRLATSYMHDAEAISQGLNGHYNDCNGGVTCFTESFDQSCQIDNDAPRYCTAEQVMVGTTTKTRTVSVTAPPVQYYLLFRAALTMPYATGTNVRISHPGSLNMQWWQIPSSFTDSQLEIFVFPDMHSFIFMQYHAQLTVTFDTEVTEPVMDWRNDCGHLQHCKKKSSTCIEGKDTRTINGYPVTLSCWKKRYRYQCSQQVDTCSALSDCALQQETCAVWEKGDCLRYHRDYTCTKKVCDDKPLICGETSFCLTGDCFEPMPDYSDDFEHSVSALAALGAAATTVEDEHPAIFTGHVEKCAKDRLQFADCCSDSGWGQNLNLTSCSNQEKTLGQAKQDGLAVKVGTYCAKKVLGVCVNRKQSYCVFDSRLATIIQQQGRAQQGTAFGKPKNPDCRGLTTDELQAIDFAQIDFSDFYDELAEGAAIPDTDILQQRIQATLQAK
jgi:conjugal transfer mating pair stabilization protein TraN